MINLFLSTGNRLQSLNYIKSNKALFIELNVSPFESWHTFSCVWRKVTFRKVGCLGEWGIVKAGEMKKSLNSGKERRKDGDGLQY